ncbi:hypothetical protein P154DRAFT_474609 [Amniculicola lignicola CBS 123094]|uniref:DUF7924 domain-containing protein n=1 Tax=Amniculicola lignicola CBS 123094 TaxID=1392246 RepID=A0A6A5W0L2_9PLEO|nr:hypothetical protein P154DRAFT_474609 [Amniculicola lignicola CBS 123094]
MKRRVSDSDTWQSSSTKRRKTQCTHAGAPRVSPPPPSTPSSQTLVLAEEALRSTQQPTPKEPKSSIQHWVENCAAVSDLEIMAAPPTPRSASFNDRGRRSTKRHARSHGSRTPSPSKRPSPQTYRTRNMYHAGVFVDNLADLPPAIDDEVRRILGIESWEDRVEATVDEPQAAAYLTGLVATFRAESRRNARECLLEGDWKASLNGLVRNLADLWPGALRTHMSEKVWNSDLKPTGSSLDELQNEDLSGTRTPRSASAQSALPNFNLSAAAVTAATFPGPIPSLPPYTQSVASTTSTEAADPYHISTPKPDITIGLAHTAFVQRHQRRLVDHQASGSILSDPHAADMGIRFPFLIVEAKGLSLNGSLITAQNQAAISGASMLTILKDLSHQAACNVNLDSDSGFQTLDPNLALPSTTLCFSIVTEGPVHELWVHFEHEDAFHMEFLQSWRTTRERDARELVHFLAQIMGWGKGRFKDCIVEKLDKVPRCGAFG